MSYMGIQELKDADLKSGSATGDGSTTTFAIGWTPPSEQSLFVTIIGVLQSASALNLSGANCVFTAAPASGDAIEFKGIQSSGTVVTTTGDGTIDAAKLADNAVTSAKIIDDAVTIDKMAGLARGSIIVGDSSGDPSALALGTSTYLLTSDGSDAAWAAAPAGGIQASEMKGWRIRPIFTRDSTTTIKLNGTFAYQHAGTTTQILTGADVTFTRSDTSGTMQMNYLYIDDSAVVTAGNTIITASELISSPTAPTLDTTKGGFYNGNDRCIYAFKQDASDDIFRWTRSPQYGNPGVVRVDYTNQFVNVSGTDYNTAWHGYTFDSNWLPRPCGPSGLAIGLLCEFGGSHSTIWVGPNTQDWDAFFVGSPFWTNCPVDDTGKLQVRSDYSHSSYTHIFYTRGWIMSPLL